MKIIVGTLTVALLVACAPGTASAQQDLQLSIQDGRVTLIAQNVPVSRILAEWARIGQSTVVNGDKVVGPPVTLHFENQPESDVLGVLLRSASGYIVAPRATVMANASVFDRILIMPPSRAPAASAVAAPPSFNTRQPPPVQIEPDVDEAPNDPVMPPGMQLPPNMPPNMPATQPMPGMPQPGQQPVPMTQPRPGMPTGVPQPTGIPPGFQPNPYGIPPQQQVLPPGVRPPGVRPPGGGDDR